MRGNERGQILVPTAEQHRGAPIIDLRQTKPAELARDFYPERTELEEIVDVLLRNFAGAIDLIGVNFVAQVIFELGQKIRARLSIFSALLRPGEDPVEIVATDEKVAGETAALVERIARGL